jgi:hypothetical protein
VFTAGALFSTHAAAAGRRSAELDQMMNWWRQQLPFCNWPGVAPYPSKFEDNIIFDPANPLNGRCNDGDGVIFNGVLCASGDDRGCDAVKRSQSTKDGEFWRSPRKVDQFSHAETPFSDDHFLGVWAGYLSAQNASDRHWREPSKSTNA